MEGQVLEGEIYSVDWVDISPDHCIFLPSLQHGGIFPCSGLELVQRAEYYSVEVMATLRHIFSAQKANTAHKPSGTSVFTHAVLRDYFCAKFTEKK